MKLILILLIVAGLACCHSPHDNNTIRDLSVIAQGENITNANQELFESVDFVALQESEGFLLSGIDALRIFDNNWYVLDNKKNSLVASFDKNGAPLHIYNRMGRAKGEYGMIVGFDVNSDTGDVYLLCGPPKIIVLDKHLQFKQEIILESPYWRVAYHNDGLVLYSPWAKGIDYVKLADGTISEFTRFDTEEQPIPGPEPTFMRDGERLFFYNECLPSVYEVTDDGMNRIVELDYPNKNAQINRASLSGTDVAKYARPIIYGVIDHDNNFSFIYSMLTYRISLQQDERIINLPWRNECRKVALRVGRSLVGWQYPYNCTPEKFNPYGFYEGVNVNYLNQVPAEDDNPVLVIYNLK
ncbi:MAG: 6-bladed beta-propeller [Rikenellaceae bacterium]|nr:6-bladed beta-propeller [Rikenellaceae bacterium]